MQIFSKYLYALSCAFILFSCAQPGTLTGGDKDVKAPVPIKSYPEMASLNIEPSQIEIVFDEFISISNPASSITVTPNTLQVKSQIKGKRLILDLEGEYLPNTTYTIGLNNAVKDITEGNDSLMLFVFSTGNEIDGGKASFMVQDAFTNFPKDAYVVGLFKDTIIKDSSNVPMYLGQTAQDGSLEFDYVKQKDFFIYAFDDVNKNGAFDRGESGGRVSEPYTIKDSITETVIVYVNEQEPKFSIEQELETPGIWSFSFSMPVDSNDVLLENDKLRYTHWYETMDSVDFYFDGLEKLEEIELIYRGGEGVDTIVKKYFPDKKIIGSEVTNLSKGNLFYKTDFKVVFNDVVKSVDTSLILVDSSQNFLSRIEIKGNQLLIPWESLSAADSLKIFFPPQSIELANLELADTLKYFITAQSLENVGKLVLKADSLFPSGFVQILMKNKLIAQKTVDASIESLVFDHLQPGNYTFRFVYDENGDGEWTPGNVFQNTAPERVVWFGESSKLRANWELESILKFE